MDEVKGAVWASGREKAPGPDGLTFKLTKKYCSIFSNDIMRYVRYFEDRVTLGKGCNSSFITLATKVKDPATLNEFNPISLFGCVYKIVSKILAIRIKAVVGDVIGEVQSAYVEGRNILDKTLIMNKISVWEKQNQKENIFIRSRLR